MSTISLEFHKIVSQCLNDDFDQHDSIYKNDIILQFAPKKQGFCWHIVRTHTVASTKLRTC